MNNFDFSGLSPEEQRELGEILGNPQAFCESFFNYPSGELYGTPYRANFPQKLVLNSQALTTWICVHRRAGKSYCMTLLALYFALTQERKQILVFAPSQSQILEFFRVLDEWIDTSDYCTQAIDHTKPNRDSPYPQRSFVTGSIIAGHITGLKEGTQEGKRGLTADYVFLDEAQEFSEGDWRVVQAIIGGDLTRLGKVRTFIAGTVREPAGHFYDKVKQIVPLETNENLIHMPITENEDYSDEARRLLRAATTEGVWRTEYLLQVGASSKSIFRVDDIEFACVDEDSRVLDPITRRPVAIKTLIEAQKTHVFDFQANNLVECDSFTVEQGLKECVKLTTHTGKRLRITKEHEFFVHGRGWSGARDILPGDKVLAVDKYPELGVYDACAEDLQSYTTKSLVSGRFVDEIFLLREKSLIKFIELVWSGCGRIFEKMNAMGFMLNNECLALDLQHLLTRLGIESRVSSDFCVWVDDEIDQRQLLNVVGVACEVYDVRGMRRWEIIIETKDIGMRNVYDVLVRHADHNFVVQDVVVHNCNWDWDLGSHLINRNPITHEEKKLPVFIGVDWDKSGAGSHIAIVSYDPDTARMYTIDHHEVPKGEFTFYYGSDIVLDLIEQYQPALIVSDGGAGEMQWEYMYLESIKRNSWFSDRIIKKYFMENIKVVNPQTFEEENKRLKPILVGLMQKKLQERKWFFPQNMRKLEEQLKVYESKVSDTGNIKFASKEDHVIDAHLFALWGIWHLFEDPLSIHSPADDFYTTISSEEQNELLKQGASDENLYGFRVPGAVNRTNLWDAMEYRADSEDSFYRDKDIFARDRNDLYGF